MNLDKYKIYKKKIIKLYYLFKNLNFLDIFIYFMGIGDWGLGIGDWGLGIGPNPQSPIPNPQSPIYNYIFKTQQIYLNLINIFIK